MKRKTKHKGTVPLSIAMTVLFESLRLANTRRGRHKNRIALNRLRARAEQ